MCHTDDRGRPSERRTCAYLTIGRISMQMTFRESSMLGWGPRSLAETSGAKKNEVKRGQRLG